MPSDNGPVITGVSGQQLSDLQEMLQAVGGAPKGVSQIIVLSPKDLANAKRVFGVRDQNIAFSVPTLGRIYIPDDYMRRQNGHPLFHEMGHYKNNAWAKTSQDDLTPQQSDALEASADKGASEYEKAWKTYQKQTAETNKVNAATNQNLQNQVAVDAQQIQAAPYSLARQLRP